MATSCSRLTSCTLSHKTNEKNVSFLISLMIILELTLFCSGLPRFGHMPIPESTPVSRVNPQQARRSVGPAALNPNPGIYSNTPHIQTPKHDVSTLQPILILSVSGRLTNANVDRRCNAQTGQAEVTERLRAGPTQTAWTECVMDGSRKQHQMLFPEEWDGCRTGRCLLLALPPEPSLGQRWRLTLSYTIKARREFRSGQPCPALEVIRGASLTGSRGCGFSFFLPDQILALPCKQLT